jgi:hypothetical protein
MEAGEMSINELAKFYAMSSSRKDAFRLAKSGKKNGVKFLKHSRRFDKEHRYIDVLFKSM